VIETENIKWPEFIYVIPDKIACCPGGGKNACTEEAGFEKVFALHGRMSE